MSDPHATTYTKDELAALPQTAAVFNQPTLNTQEHDWIQRGYMIEDACRISKPTCVSAGIPIPPGSLLIKDAKGYRLVSETTRQ